MDMFDHTNTSKALFKNTGIIAIGQISTKIINFLLLPIYTAALNTEEYGIVDLLSTYSTFIAVIVGLQLNQAIFRFLVTNRKDSGKVKEIVSTVLTISIVALLVYSFLFVAIQSLIVMKFKWFLLFQVVATVYLQILSGIARGLGYNHYYAIGNFLSATITLVMNIIIIIVLKLGIGSMLIAYIVGPFVGGSFLWIKCHVKKYFSISKISKKEITPIIKYSLPLIPNEISWSLIHSSDRMIVSSVLSVAANGLIAVASKFSVIYTTFFSIFNTSWTEQVVLHYRDNGGPEYISDMFNKMVTFFGTLAVGIIACMPFVFEILVNEQFSDAYGLVPFYMIAVFFNAIIGMISAVYLVENETKFVAISTAVAAGINVIVDLAIISLIGVYAAPISSICGYMAVSFWRLIDINRRHCKIRMKKKNVLLLVSILIIALVSFYTDKLILNILLLASIICLGGILNKDFFKEFLYILKQKRDGRF